MSFISIIFILIEDLDTSRTSFSFKDMNIRRAVPFWGVLAAVAAFAVISLRPAMVLFLLIVGYSLSGYAGWLVGWRARRRGSLGSARPPLS